MKFKPLSDKYEFDDVLHMGIPVHLREPIENWMRETLKRKKLLVQSGVYVKWFITDGFKESLHVNFRETYPRDWSPFAAYVFGDAERAITILQFCLSYLAHEKEANHLEHILRVGGSGYRVVKTNEDAGAYTEGAYDLIKRVPEALDEAAKPALDQNQQLMEAWRSCYGVEPNYGNVVQQCQNVLEEVLRDDYLPNDKAPQLGKLIGDIEAGKIMAFKGCDVPEDPNILLKLIDKIPGYRGMHTAGTGKDPSKDQAEYILHTTIYFWGLHRT